ncbi:MAG: archaeosine synthase subunit alpha [Haloferacaceae archaeon]
MTDYFEVHDRDGAARLGELRLADPVTTPALVDDVLADAGSLWRRDRDLPEGDEGVLTVLPHRAFPAGTREEVQEAFAVEHPDVDYPAAAVVTPETATDLGVDAYVLSTARGVAGHAAAFVEAVVAVNRATPPDTALYAPGVATPRNAAVLAYAGVDLFDAKLARVRGRQGRYLTTEGSYDLDELSELPGRHPRDPPLPEFDREAAVDHNVAALSAELATVRTRIRRGRLRDYVEGQARHEGWLTATFRELDQEWAYLERRTPVVRAAEMTAASEDTLQRVEIRRFADRVTARYRSEFDDPLVLVPCSARKPYSDSQSHRQFRDAIEYRGHVVSMTSPIGVVPQELELTYPAQHYDSVVTGRWTAGEKEFVAEVLRRYLARNDYDRVVAHVPPEGYRDICETVAADVDADFEYTVEDHPTTEASLSNLRAALSGDSRYRKRERQHRTLRAVADYQFGEGAGEALLPDPRVTGRYPKLQARDDDGEQLAALVPRYGTLALTLHGARRALDRSVPVGRVAIDDFVPHGSVLAPGVSDADGDVRPGDEVIVEGPRAIAVGRAAMSGPEMTDSTRGVAVQVRHVDERDG